MLMSRRQWLAVFEHDYKTTTGATVTVGYSVLTLDITNMTAADLLRLFPAWTLFTKA